MIRKISQNKFYLKILLKNTRNSKIKINNSNQKLKKKSKIISSFKKLTNNYKSNMNIQFKLINNIINKNFNSLRIQINKRLKKQNNLNYNYKSCN